MSDKRVLVCGGRTVNDRDLVFAELDKHSADWGPFKTVIQGGAGGADRLAKIWAEERGLNVVTFPADWKTYGAAAGPIRNQRMIDEGKPDLVLAFWDGISRGTRDMIDQARRAKVAFRIFPISSVSTKNNP